MRAILTSTLLLTLLAGAPAVRADAAAPVSAAPLERPKVCLVLSGGGARGAAHVGVIEAMEQLHIPIDCIVGTSMGAIVGGLYAAGMSAQELELQMNRPALQADMANAPPRSRLSFKDKQDELKYLLRAEFGYADDKYFLPQGIANGNAPGRILNVLTVALTPDQDFDKLPIPFRAVATDITNGDMVVLDHGSLADAIHASMSIPGLYPPVHIDDRLLVDGGLSRNLAIDVARKMGAQVVIAVNIQTQLSTGNELTDVFSVSLQVLKLYGNQNVKDSIATLTSKDALVEPELGDIGPTDFERMGEAVKLGQKAGMETLSKRSDLMLSAESYSAYEGKFRKIPGAPQRIDFVDVSGNAGISPELIRARFGIKSGDVWDQQKINDGLRRLYDLGYFNRVDAVLQHKGDRSGLQIVVTPKEWRPNYLQFGIHISDDFEGDSTYELLGSYTVSEIDSRGAEWRNQFEIGKTRLFYSEFNQPLDFRGRVFVAPNVEYLNETFYLFRGQDRIAEYSTVFPRADLDLGFAVGDVGEVRAGVFYGHLVSQPRIGDPNTLPSFRHRLVGPHFGTSFDTFDNGNFPSSGSYAQVSGYFPRESLGGDISYSKVDATFGQAFALGDASILAVVEGGSNLGSALPLYEQFQLGGFLSLAGERQGQLRGDRIFDAHAIYAWRAGSLPTGVGRGWYFGFGVDAGTVWGNTNLQPGDSGMQYGTTLFLGADTLAGPLYFGIGAGKSGNRTFFLYLGIPINGNTLAPSFGN